MCLYSLCDGDDWDCQCLRREEPETAPVQPLPEPEEEPEAPAPLLPSWVRPVRPRRRMPEGKMGEHSRCDLIPEAYLTTPARAKRARRQAREASRNSRGGMIPASKLLV